jgi:hypothetical protein
MKSFNQPSGKARLTQKMYNHLMQQEPVAEQKLNDRLSQKKKLNSKTRRQKLKNVNYACTE